MFENHSKKSHFTKLRAKRATLISAGAISAIFGAKIQIFEKYKNNNFGVKIQIRHYW